MSGKQLKVVLINHSDIHGGAAVVTYRLMYALRRAGVDAKMLVYTKYSSDPNVEVVSTRLKRGLVFSLERIKIMRNNGFNRDDLFKVSIANHGVGIASNRLVKDADVVVLSWINQGLVSLDDLKRLGKMGKPVVWIMHDMWAMTGICHHSLGCDFYKRQCGNCRFLGVHREKTDLSHQVWKKKNEIYGQTPIHYVAVSNWVKDRAMESSLLHDKPVDVIHNAFPVETFPIEIPEDLRPFSMKSDKRYILMGAARLDDPIKGLPMAIEALNHIFDEYPAISNTTEMIFFGGLKNQDAFENLRFPYRYVGVIRDQALLRRMYASSAVVVSSSLYESLAGTLIEGQAAGALPVSFGAGGQCDIIEHKKNGYIAEYRDTQDLANGIMWALRQPTTRAALHGFVEEKFSSDIIASKYIELFNKMLKK